MTCRAILHRDRIEWLDAPPAEIENAPVEVVFRETPPLPAGKTQGRLVAEALEQSSKLGPIRDIEEPVPWQREIREDVKHQGREIAELLEQLAQRGTFEHIEDPVAWQREIREDVKLPGRD